MILNGAYVGVILLMIIEKLDLRRECFLAADILKLIILVNKNQDKNISEMIKHKGFNNLWNEYNSDQHTLRADTSYPNGVDLLNWTSEISCSSFTVDCPEITNFNSYHLLAYLKKYGVYLAEILYESQRPHVSKDKATAVSYWWRRDLVHVLGHCIHYAYSRHYDTRDENYVWLDIVNINQNSRNLSEELTIVPTVYTTAEYHILISKENLRRGWCFFECALRTSAIHSNNNLKSTHIPERDDVFEEAAENFLKLKAVIRKAIFKFQNSKFTEESDREFVKNKIDQLLGSVSEAEYLMLKAFDMQQMPDSPVRPKKITQQKITQIKELALQNGLSIPEEELQNLLT